MSIPWTVVAAAVALNALTTTPTHALPLSASEHSTNRWDVAATTDDVIKERIKRLSLPFEAKYTAKVRGYIQDFTRTGRQQTNKMLGRTTMYFPIFEHYLAVHRLPKQLMYLPIVESSMMPNVKSPAGAAGLWQLMPQTAHRFGLKVNGAVDERLDPYRSTEAAARMLKILYKQYRDWRLVLVAYNCGTGKLDQAIRMANSRNYWKLEPYLPMQTRRYVPAYIAAAYVVHYQRQHKLKPVYPSLHLRETRAVKVYQALTFRQVAAACDLAPAVLATLNPGYLQRVVPKNAKGQFLILPASAVSNFKNYIAGKNVKKVQPSVPEGKFKTSYVVAKGDNIKTLAKLFQCTAQDIVKWNALTESEVFVNQELVIYLPKGVVYKRA